MQYSEFTSLDACSPCGEGLITAGVGSTSFDDCETPPGYIYDDTSEILDACPVGEFSVGGSVVTACTVCPTNASNASAGSSSCECMPGMYLDGTGCVSCGINSFKIGLGDQRCDLCIPGTSTDGRDGCTSYVDCTLRASNSDQSGDDDATVSAGTIVVLSLIHI